MTNATPSTPSDQPIGEPPPPSTQPPLRPELRRSGSDKLAGGVCGGLAEYSGIDSLLWRVGFVGLTIAGGAGILVYLLLWVLMPPAPTAANEPVSALEQLARRLHDAVSGSRFSSSGR
jgi:phage shock protein C